MVIGFFALCILGEGENLTFSVISITILPVNQFLKGSKPEFITFPIQEL